MDGSSCYFVTNRKCVGYYTLNTSIFLPSGYNLSMASIKAHKGDDGTTSLIGESRLSKYDPRIEALGSLDEASAALGLARALGQAPQVGSILVHVQRDLYTLMTRVAAGPDQFIHFRTVDLPDVQWLDKQIETISALAPSPAEFILPGDSLAGAALSLARTIVRRAERRVAVLLKDGGEKYLGIMQYLNRLSSLCFTLELLENQHSGTSTTLAKK
jgi:cob(I)alamin adenosyltransferase